MKLIVKNYNRVSDFHTCVDEQNKTHRVDLLIDGGLGNIPPEDLIGKIVEVDWLYPYIEMAQSPRIVDTP